MLSKFKFDISIPKFTLSVDSQKLVEESKVIISSGKTYVLFGQNGTGKSTFLKKLFSREKPFNNIDKRVDIFLVEQEFIVTDKSVFETVIESNTILKKLKNEEEEILLKCDKEEDTEQDQQRLEEIYDQLDFIQSDRAESMVKKVLSGLQFSPEMMEKSANIFSGGWRMRISLARGLFIKPKLLLLDEPTNHLDLHANIWLQHYLKSYKETIIVVSHDRDFINSVGTDILHIWNKKLFQYKGKKMIIEKKGKKSRDKQLSVLDIYEDELQRRIDNYNKEYEKQQKEINKYKRNCKNFMEELEKEKNKNKGKNKNTELLINNNSILLERLKPYKIKINFNCTTQLSNIYIKVNNLVCGYNNKPIISDINFEFTYTDKIALVGANGCGKTTFINAIIDTYNNNKNSKIIQNGTIELPNNMRMAVFNQFNIDYLDFDVSPVQYLCEKYKMQSQDAKKYLGDYGLDRKYHRMPISNLSGGQKSRIVFIEIQLQNPHFMLLDEPTNNLDIETVSALKSSLSKYEGGFIIITHQLDIIDDLCDMIWYCKDGEINEYDGDIYDYSGEILGDLI